MNNFHISIKQNLFQFERYDICLVKHENEPLCLVLYLASSVVFGSHSL